MRAAELEVLLLDVGLGLRRVEVCMVRGMVMDEGWNTF